MGFDETSIIFKKNASHRRLGGGKLQSRLPGVLHQILENKPAVDLQEKLFLEKLNLSTRRPGVGVIISGFRLRPFIAKLQSFVKLRFY